MKAIDLFAGAGGFTEGAIMSGVDVVWAANHWQIAVQVHADNHPNTRHVCQDLHQCDWSAIPAHDIVLASPACQGHARARGKERPHHDADRATAWAVVSCLEMHRTPFAIIENVPDFLYWELFPAWRLAIETLGYTLTVNSLNAADFGVPQARERIFIVASRNKPITLKAPNRKHVSAMELIQWDKGEWGTIAKPLTGRPRAESSKQQIRAGKKRFGKRFYFAYYGNDKKSRDPNKPLGTITTRDTFAAVDGNRVRMLSIDECKAAMGFRPDYQLARTRKDSMKMLGNAVCPPVVSNIIDQIRKAA